MLKVINDFHELKDLVLIVPTSFSDNRGNFMELYNRRALSEKGLNRLFVQDNIVSSKKGVLRGLHFQKYHQQGKLVSVINGKIFDLVFADPPYKMKSVATKLLSTLLDLNLLKENSRVVIETLEEPIENENFQSKVYKYSDKYVTVYRRIK